MLHLVQTMRTADDARATPPVAGAPGLRERQKRARRAALVDAAQDLVDRDGLDAVTVEAICARAEVSTRTFFNYFASKDDAVLALEHRPLDAATCTAFAAGGPTGHLRADLELLLVALVEQAGVSGTRMARAMELARREPRLLGRQVAAFEQHHAQVAALVAARLGTPATAPRAAALTVLVLHLTRAAFLRWEGDGGRRPVGEAVPLVLDDLRDLLVDLPPTTPAPTG